MVSSEGMLRFEECESSPSFLLLYMPCVHTVTECASCRVFEAEQASAGGAVVAFIKHMKDVEVTPSRGTQKMRR